MGKVLQKKKARSGRSTARAKDNRLKTGHKKINVLGNQIIADNWDRKLTLTQNYQRLGLMHKLNAPSGGRERLPAKDEQFPENKNSLHIRGSAKADAAKVDLGSARVERDPETGAILRVIHDEDDDHIEVAGRHLSRKNPLNDPLNEVETGNGENNMLADSVIVQQLERQADQEGKTVRAKKPRFQSSREGEWAQRLIEKHGDDFTAMARDRKLNPMQQSIGDLRRRITKWQKSQ
ncbi:Ribosome biogenesis protein Nop16 [Penicillium brevicompactum]|uniref:Nucleolar protein 16 n=1 Tax=Penicillium brevicompactum TaxID=5074 RepID=A0A9W9RDA5_PENBR|nr:Ribosome biogenesis protein Nop16 [Penicillium brevicompactum]KAJ5336381.1 Ribosome biogenesis protein Nop16 [Penicillium brevicompactum]KAJ5357405.1 Ribosome biogenesis protein Nop16 [Penicillium brevicompactum]